jgi:hypothetical protein
MSAKAEKRKKIQYRDLSAAVGALELLHFLSDTIPKTQTVKMRFQRHRAWPQGRGVGGAFPKTKGHVHKGSKIGSRNWSGA